MIVSPKVSKSKNNGKKKGSKSSRSGSLKHESKPEGSKSDSFIMLRPCWYLYGFFFLDFKKSKNLNMIDMFPVLQMHTSNNKDIERKKKT